MSAGSGVELACMLAVESVGQTTSVFDLGSFAYCYILEDRVDRCSSYIHYSAKNC